MPKTLYTDDPAAAAALLRRGGLVAFPTETVYGLGADATNATALAAIFEAKKRPADNPLIVHLAAADAVPTVAAEVPPDARRLMDRFFPGPLTLVLLRRPDLPDAVSAGRHTVGVRVPDHALARQFLEACGIPVAAPSANRSGRPSPTTWTAVRDDLDGRVDAVLRGTPTRTGLESTVVDCTGPEPVVLRVGSVSLEDLQRAVPSVRLASDADDVAGRSPGLRHRHYAPRARVVRVHAPPPPMLDAGYIGRTPPADGFGLAHVVPTVEAYAQGLFDFFRRCDAARLRVIYCETVPIAGIGRALADRIERAERATG